jgi:hypothetical protein
VGAGGSLEATYPLVADIKAGTWHLVGDGIIINSGDVTFEILWRDSTGDHLLASFMHHFDPLPSGYTAQPYEDDAAGVATAGKPGDLLVLRFKATGTTTGLVYIPNGDGAKAMGRIPNLTLPK